jgi:kynurenine 3-monooxygenase
MNYQQVYIKHGYKQLTIPATSDGNFAMNPSYLHIWPRQSFMLIALPNTDRTFTCTLFMSLERFAEIQTATDLLSFYQKEFPDALLLMGQDLLVHDFFENPTGSLLSIKVKPVLIKFFFLVYYIIFVLVLSILLSK